MTAPAPIQVWSPISAFSPMTARSATITSLPSRAEACDHCAGMRPGLALRGRTKKPGGTRKRQPGMAGNQKRLGTSRFRAANSPAITAAARDASAAAQTLFIFDKHQVRRGRLRNAGDSAHFDGAISHHLRLAPLRQPKGVTASLHLCIRLAGKEKPAGSRMT